MGDGQGDGMNLLLNADARHIPLADGSVNCCVTSPPYYGLRDYGTAEWVGGDAECDHVMKNARNDAESRALLDGSVREGASTIQYRDVCPKCGAIRVDNQIGLEPTPDEYVAGLVQVFREVKRVLRDDGTCWLNLGDSYNGSGKGGNPADSEWKGFVGNNGRETSAKQRKTDIANLKPKDLIGIPWRVAFALQADGWYLRQDIIWAKACSGDIRKGSAMPESVRDRFQKSHEYVFLLTKSPRYYFDNEAVKDTVDNPETHEYNYQYENKDMYSVQGGEARGDVQRQQPADGRFDGLLQGLPENNPQGVGSEVQCQPKGEGNGEALLLFGKGSSNKKGVQGWIRTDGGTAREVSESGSETRKRGKVQEAPEEIRSKREGEIDQSDSGQTVCQDGQGTIRETQNSNQAKLSDKNNRLHVGQDGLGGTQEDTQEPVRLLRSTEEAGDGSRDPIEQRGNTYKGKCGSIVQNMQRQEGGKVAGNRRSVWLINTANYSGAHYAVFPPDLIEPCVLAGCPPGGIVLDPFIGSGTTAMVARKHGRHAIGLDLNFEYLTTNARERLQYGSYVPVADGITQLTIGGG